jgi:hypothetical protein
MTTLKNTTKMKIYAFKYPGGETDWVFAPKIKEAEEFYINHTGCGDLDECEVSRVPKKEWSSHLILDINESEPDLDEVDYNEDDYSCGYKIKETFAEYAAREKTTDLIATTEY